MNDVKKISIKDYNYTLPDERIAKFPVTPRDTSKLLVYRQGTIVDDHFFNLKSYLSPNSLMVFNNTRVIQARLLFRKNTGALIEIFLLEPFAPADYEQMFQSNHHCAWLCLVGNLKKWKSGALVRTIDKNGQVTTITATLRSQHDTSQIIDIEWDSMMSFAEVIDTIGELPIPPYLNRNTQESDLTTYQTIYSKIKGSVAAPTAGLHFTTDVLASLDEDHIDREEITLHVGAGTFKPVKSEHMDGHIMHTEHVCVSRGNLEKLLAHQCFATAVGTTSVRTLESLYYLGLRAIANPDISEEQMHVTQWEPYETNNETPTREQVKEAIMGLVNWMDFHQQRTLRASTQIIIVPGYDFKIVSQLITNFHQPQSTLLLLVSAFTKGHWHEIYEHALKTDYRFLSYGDSSLLVP